MVKLVLDFLLGDANDSWVSQSHAVSFKQFII